MQLFYAQIILKKSAKSLAIQGLLKVHTVFVFSSNSEIFSQRFRRTGNFAKIKSILCQHFLFITYFLILRKFFPFIYYIFLNRGRASDYIFFEKNIDKIYFLMYNIFIYEK